MIAYFKFIIKKFLTKYYLGGYVYLKIMVILQFLFLNERRTIKKMIALRKFDDHIIYRIEPESTMITVGPKSIANRAISEKVNLPALNIYKFQNCLVNAKSNCILYRQKIIYESYHENERFNKGFIKWHNTRQAVVNIFPVEEIEDGFFLAGLGSSNWYHWLIEILPKAMYLDKVPTKKILVSEFVTKYPTMKETLHSIIGADYRLIFLDSNKNYLIKRLFYINAISYVPFEFIRDAKLRVQDVFMRAEVLRKMKGKIVNSLVVYEQDSSLRRVFIERNHHRVPVNQDKIATELKKIGFHKVKVEEFNFDKQVALFSNAEYIIGTSGAAFTNLIFSSRGTRLICFMPESFGEFSCFSNLADIFGVDLTYIFYKLDSGKHHYSNDFEVDVDQVLEAIKCLGKPENFKPKDF